ELVDAATTAKTQDPTTPTRVSRCAWLRRRLAPGFGFGPSPQRSGEPQRKLATGRQSPAATAAIPASPPAAVQTPGSHRRSPILLGRPERAAPAKPRHRQELATQSVTRSDEDRRAPSSRNKPSVAPSVPPKAPAARRPNRPGLLPSWQSLG